MPIVVLAVAAFVVLGSIYYIRRGALRRPSFPPVVEQARTAASDRLGFKIATIGAHPPTHATPPNPAPPVPPGIPFLDTLPPDSLVGIPDATRSPSVRPAPVAPPAPRSPILTLGLEQPPSTSVYEVRSGPYAAPVVHGSRISLPDADETDLPIAFRSTNPAAVPIVEAGERAEQIQVAGPDGRIHVSGEGAVAFGPAVD